MVSDAELRDPHLRELYGQIDPIMGHARQVAAALTPGQLRWRPAPRSWSVGDCLEHLIITADLYCDRIESLLETADKPGDTTPWRPSLLGRMAQRGYDIAPGEKAKTIQTTTGTPARRSRCLLEVT